MAKVVIDLSMSLDGFIAGPGDGAGHPLGQRGGEHLFDWYFSGATSRPRGSMFRPEGNNQRIVDGMFNEAGAMLTGRRTYEIARGWNGTHPVNAIPVIIVTHEIPQIVPKGKSPLIFVTDGIRSAVEKAKQAAGEKAVGIGSASVAQQCLQAGLVDELHIHVAPMLLGAGVRLFESLQDAIRLEIIEVVEAPHATHLRYGVVRCGAV